MTVHFAPLNFKYHSYCKVTFLYSTSHVHVSHSVLYNLWVQGVILRWSILYARHLLHVCWGSLSLSDLRVLYVLQIVKPLDANLLFK